MTLPAKTNKALPARKSVFARFKEHQLQKRRGTRIGFIVDATGSREESWERAQTIQAGMFRKVAALKALHLRLMYFGGGLIANWGWQDNPRTVAARMAQTRCLRGLTQFLPALTSFIDEAAETKADAIILIGDCFEEDIEQAAKVAQALKASGIKVFAFLEGEDWTAASVFRTFAETTGGAFGKFGEELPLAPLCEGVALLTAGGKKAVRKIENKKVRLLLTDGTRRTKP